MTADTLQVTQGRNKNLFWNVVSECGYAKKPEADLSEDGMRNDDGDFDNVIVEPARDAPSRQKPKRDRVGLNVFAVGKFREQKQDSL